MMYSLNVPKQNNYFVYNYWGMKMLSNVIVTPIIYVKYLLHSIVNCDAISNCRKRKKCSVVVVKKLRLLL